MEHTGFPSDETLAAYIDGRLDSETRRRVIEHMTACAECYSVFMGATKMSDGKAVSPTTRRFSRRAWYAVAAAAIAAVAAIIVLITVPRHDNGMMALAESAPPLRTIEGRLSGFPYRPMAALKRGAAGDPLKDPANAKLLTSSAHVQESATKRPTSANLHALGVSHLLLGRYDDAIRELEASLMKESDEQTVPNAIQESNDVALLGDLSVALSARSRAARRIDADAGEAVRCAERAWRIQKNAETSWNRAVAIEALNGDAGAASAWREYLTVDSTSPWAAEARERLAKIAQE